MGSKDRWLMLAIAGLCGLIGGTVSPYLFAARAFPPLDAPSADSACACMFLPSAGLRTSPMACSTTLTATWEKSVRLPPLLARAGIRGVWQIY